MTELTQLYTVNEHGHGDCLRTALACVLDMARPEDVPVFLYHDDWTENDDWFPELIRWLYERGWELSIINLEAVREGREMAPGALEMLDGYYVVGGISPRTYPDGSIMHHAVVAKGREMEIVHDPHPFRTGIVGLPERAYGLARCDPRTYDNQQSNE